MLSNRQQRVLEALPQDARPSVAATFEKPTPHRIAIRAYCLMCKQGSKAEIKDCADEVCPLRLVRPYIPQQSTQEDHQQ